MGGVNQIHLNYVLIVCHLEELFSYRRRRDCGLLKRAKLKLSFFELARGVSEQKRQVRKAVLILPKC